MNKMGFKGDIQAIYIENLQTRVLRLRLSGEKLTINDVTQWIERPGIVDFLPHVILNGDVAVTQAQ